MPTSRDELEMPTSGDAPEMPTSGKTSTSPFGSLGTLRRWTLSAMGIGTHTGAYICQSICNISQHDVFSQRSAGFPNRLDRGMSHPTNQGKQTAKGSSEGYVLNVRLPSRAFWVRIPERLMLWISHRRDLECSSHRSPSIFYCFCVPGVPILSIGMLYFVLAFVNVIDMHCTRARTNAI